MIFIFIEQVKTLNQGTKKGHNNKEKLCDIGMQSTSTVWIQKVKVL